jgi:hypothetical protein
MQKEESKNVIECTCSIKGIRGRDRKEKSHTFKICLLDQAETLDQDKEQFAKIKLDLESKIEKILSVQKFKSCSKVILSCEYCTVQKYQHDDGEKWASTQRLLFDDRNYKVEIDLSKIAMAA